MRMAALTFVVLLAACDGSSYNVVPPPAPQKTVVVLFGADAETTLNGSLMDDGLVPALRAAGYELASLDLPCHTTGNMSVALECWRSTIEGGDSDLFHRYCRELSRRLTELGATDAVAIAQSRGAYVAVTCASTEFRFSRLVLLKPVTDLTRLSEFAGGAVDPRLYGLGQYRFALLGRPIHVLIGANDTRVSTDAAVLFAALFEAEIELTDTVDHYLPDGGYTTRWVLSRL